MTLDALFGFFRLPARGPANDNAPRDATWDEPFVTAAAVTTAVAVVALIAVVMGMSSTP
jgi:hypothetical protein